MTPGDQKPAPLTIAPPAPLSSQSGSLAAAGGGAGGGVLVAAILSTMPEGPPKIIATAAIPLVTVALTRILDSIVRVLNRRNRRRDWEASLASTRALCDNALQDKSLTAEEKAFFLAALRDLRRYEFEERQAEVFAARRAKQEG